MLRNIVISLSLVTSPFILAANPADNSTDEAKKSAASSNSITYDTVTLSEKGSDSLPLILDLAQKNTIDVSSAKPGRVYLRVINMLPTQRGNYSITQNSELVPISAFTKPTPNDISVDSDGAPLSPATNTPCEDLKSVMDDVNDATAEDSAFVSNVAKLRNHYDLAQKVTNDDNDNNNCGQGLLTAAEQTIKNTALNITLDLEPNTKSTVTVIRNNVVKNTANFEAKRTQWMTHMGFTFVDNRGQSYYSKFDGTSSYTVSKQNNNDDILYAATVLFTYPFWQTPGHGFGVGWTAGIGSTLDNIQVTTGVGLIIGDNFLINIGGTAMQFEELKGTYAVNDDLGSTAVDSTDLVTEEFGFALSLSLGYKFN